MTDTYIHASDVEKVAILADALPYMQAFRNKVMVVKYGGNAMLDEAMKASFAYDIAMLKHAGIQVVVVHGGGPDIDKMMHKLGKKVVRKEGMRVTDASSIEAVEMVLSGKINREIVTLLCQKGLKAVGVSGRDNACIKASFINQEALGFVGEVNDLDASLFNVLLAQDFIPVVAPIGVSAQGEVFNINADLVAGKIASTLCCEKLILMTNTAGILSSTGDLLSTLTIDQLLELIADGVITGGMLPKVRCTMDSIEEGVHMVHMIDGRVKHALLLELFTGRGIGTLISKSSVE